MSKALRYNDNKPEYSLLDLASLESCIRVLEFGAKKYSIYEFFSIFVIQEIINEKWKNQKLVKDVEITLKNLSPKNYVQLVTEMNHIQKQHVVNVEKLDYLLEKLEFADLAMKKIGFVTDLKSWNLNEDIKKNIIPNQKTFLKNENEIKKDVKTLFINLKSNNKNFFQDYLNTDLQKNSIILFVTEDVQCVEVKKDYTLIMTIPMENLEISCVVNVTKELDCYKILLKLLEKFTNISLNISDISKFLNGRDNWKKGFPISKILDSLLRHIAELQKGNWLDEESNLPHIGHIQANALFLGCINNTINIDMNKNKISTFALEKTKESLKEKYGKKLTNPFDGSEFISDEHLMEYVNGELVYKKEYLEEFNKTFDYYWSLHTLKMF